MSSSPTVHPENLCVIACVACRNQTLKQVLDDYRFFPGIGVHWIFMGPNQRLTRPDEGGVLRHYTKCQPVAAVTVKMIANMFFVKSHSGPRNFVFRCVSEDHEDCVMVVAWQHTLYRAWWHLHGSTHLVEHDGLCMAAHTLQSMMAFAWQHTLCRAWWHLHGSTHCIEHDGICMAAHTL